MVAEFPGAVDDDYGDDEGDDDDEEGDEDEDERFNMRMLWRPERRRSGKSGRRGRFSYVKDLPPPTPQLLCPLLLLLVLIFIPLPLIMILLIFVLLFLLLSSKSLC